MAKYIFEEFKERVRNNTLTLSYSGAKHLLGKNPMQDFCNYYTGERVSNDAFNFGKALHIYLLENSRFNDLCAISPANIRGDKKELFLSENLNKESIISESEFAKIQTIYENLKDSEYFATYITSAEQKEQHFQMDILGIPFEGYIDAHKKGEAITDIKTSGAFSNFRYTLQDYDYDLQGAIYTHSQQVERFLLLAIDKASLMYQFFELSKDSLRIGFEKLKLVVERYNSLRLGIDSIDFSTKKETIIFI